MKKVDTCKFTAIARSPSVLTDYSVEFRCIPTADCAAFEERDRFSALCRSGCKNYDRKWCCPPHSPGFSHFTRQWRRLYIGYFIMPLPPFSHIKNQYLRIKAANTMLKSRADRFMRMLARKFGAYISTGSCRLCKPCKYQKGLPCAHPDEMAYSFEALGINVVMLVERYFDTPLLWYRRGYLPPYTAVVCGLLTNETVPLSFLRDYYLQAVPD